MNNFRRALFAGLFDIVNQVKSTTRPREREAKPAPGSSTQRAGREKSTWDHCDGLVSLADTRLKNRPSHKRRHQYVKRHLRRKRHLWQIRHCERSEAIQSDPRSRNESCAAELDCFVAEPVIRPATSGRTRWLLAMTHAAKRMSCMASPSSMPKRPGEARIPGPAHRPHQTRRAWPPRRHLWQICHLWQVVIMDRRTHWPAASPLQNANKRMLKRSVTYAEFCHLWQKSKT